MCACCCRPTARCSRNCPQLPRARAPRSRRARFPAARLLEAPTADRRAAVARSTAPNSTTAPADPIRMPRGTRLARQRAALRPAVARRRAARRATTPRSTGARTCSTATTGRPALAPGLPALMPRARARRRVLTIHNLAFQGMFEPQPLAALGLPPDAYSIGRRRVLRQALVPQGRPALRRSRSPPSARPTRRRSRREPLGFGPAGPAAPRARRACTGILNGIDTDVVESGHRPAASPARYGADTLAAQGRKQARAAARGSACRRTRTCRCSAWSAGSPSRRASTSLARHARRDLRRCRRSSSLLGTGERRLESGVAASSRAAHPRQVARHDRLRRGARAPDRGRRRRLPDALALRALRPQPDVQPALRHAAHRARHRRARRHRGRLHAGRRSPTAAPAASFFTSPAPRRC